MNLFHTPDTMRAWSFEQRAAGKTIGFVPTMGALHEGHASLLRAARAENDIAIVSIFVNPTQFGPKEDLGKYPRTFDADCAMCSAIGVDAAYVPDASVMYQEGYSTYVHVEKLTEGLCGRSRPTHFRGVATVVAKLFNAVFPHRAYFGQKDAQQVAVLRRMARDLDFGIEIVEMPIVREPDGLAMSSRNRYMTADERIQALSLSRGLAKAQMLFDNGERNAHALRDAVISELTGLNVDYVEVVDAETLDPVDPVQNVTLIAVAAFVGSTRLIDNIKLSVKQCVQ